MKMRARSELPCLMALTPDLINKGDTLSQQNQEEAVVAQTEDPAEAEAEAVLRKRKKIHVKISLLRSKV